MDRMAIEILHGRSGSAKQNVAVLRSYGDKKSQEQSLPEMKTIKPGAKENAVFTARGNMQLLTDLLYNSS